jgi:SAM-dependent methyltransferase
MCAHVIDEKRWNEAQQNEIAFWQDVRRNGYGGAPYPMWREIYPLAEMWNYTVGSGHPLDYFRDKVVVEVGSGPLGIVAALPAKEKVGLDPLSDAYDKLFDRPTEVHYMASKGEQIPLSDGYADVVFCKNVLDHVHNPAALLSEVRRILKHDGLFILVVNLAGTGTQIPTEDTLHPYSFTAQGVMQMVTGAGFGIEKAQGGGEWSQGDQFIPTWFLGVLRG